MCWLVGPAGCQTRRRVSLALQPSPCSWWQRCRRGDVRRAQREHEQQWGTIATEKGRNTRCCNTLRLAREAPLLRTRCGIRPTRPWNCPYATHEEEWVCPSLQIPVGDLSWLLRRRCHDGRDSASAESRFASDGWPHDPPRSALRASAAARTAVKLKPLETGGSTRLVGRQREPLASPRYARSRGSADGAEARLTDRRGLAPARSARVPAVSTRNSVPAAGSSRRMAWPSDRTVAAQGQFRPRA
jgi:hypothetical protein